MRRVLTGLFAIASLGFAQTVQPARAEKETASAQPSDGPYTFTGLAVLQSGSSSCLNGTKANIGGDAIVSSHGNGFSLHIKSSSATAAILAQFKGNGSLLSYGSRVGGGVTYFVLPSTTQEKGQFASVSQPGTQGVVFGIAMTLVTGPLNTSGSGTCRVGLHMNFVPGANKALLQLLNGVL